VLRPVLDEKPLGSPAKNDHDSSSGDKVITITELSTRSLIGEGLRSTDYLTNPCCCCGQRDHSMITRTHSPEGTSIMRSACPNISNLRVIDTTTTSEGDVLIFDIDAGILAKAHDSNFYAALSSIGDMRRNGILRKVDSRKLEKFKIILARYCEEGQTQAPQEKILTPPTEEGVLLMEVITNRLGSGEKHRLNNYYLRPCQCCGEKGHSLLRNRGTKTMGILETMCPYVSRSRIRKTTPTDIGEVLEYEVRVEVLAEAVKFNFMAAHYVLSTMIHNSAIGTQSIPQDRIDQFRKILKEHCGRKRNEVIWKEFREAPCRGCGSPFHGLLEYDHLRGKHRYKCPCMLCDEWNPNQWYEDNTLKYQLCPTRLAREHGYDERRVRTALNRHIERGAGRFITPEKLGILQERALRACQRYNLHQGDSPSILYPPMGSSTRIIGIEGWGQPRQRGTTTTAITNQEEVSQGTRLVEGRGARRALIIAALIILITLLFYMSRIIPHNPSKSLTRWEEGVERRKGYHVSG